LANIYLFYTRLGVTPSSGDLIADFWYYKGIAAPEAMAYPPTGGDRLLWWGIDIRVGTSQAIALFRQGMSQYPTLST
jgi:hypothetical protein